MRRDTENRVENYIKKHKNYKRWLAFALCIALFTGTVTLYMLNKPATAMTEDGAKEVGLVLETADNDFEQGLIEQMETGDDKKEEESEEASSELESSDKESEVSSDESTISEDYSEESSSEKTSTDEAVDDASAYLASEQSSSAASSASSEDKSASKASSAASSLASSKEALDVPESVDLAEYVTETIIERKNADGSWERISEDEIKDGDYIRVTFNYSIPKEATLSDDIHMDIPEEFNFINSKEAELSDGSGSYEITEDNQIIIQYNDDVKQEIIDDASEGSDLQASLSLSKMLGSFFNIFTLTVHAEENITSSVSGEGTYTSSSSTSTPSTSEGVTITGAILTVNGTKYQNTSEVQISNATDIEFEVTFNLAPGTISADNNVFYLNLDNLGIVPSWSVANGDVTFQGTKVGSYVITRDYTGSNGLITFTIDEEYAELNGKVLSGDFYFKAECDASSADENNKINYRFSDEVYFTVEILANDNYDVSVDKEASEYNESTNEISYSVKVSSTKGTNGAFKYTDQITVSNDSSLNNEIKWSDISKVNITKYNADGAAVSTNTLTVSDNDNIFETDLEGLTEGQYYIIEYILKVPDKIANSSDAKIINNKAIASSENFANKDDNTNTTIEGSEPYIKKEGSADNDTQVVTWTVTLNSNQKNLRGYTLTDLLYYLDSDDNYQIKTTPFVGTLNFSSTTGGKSFSYDTSDGTYTFPDEDDYNTYVITYEYPYTAKDIIYGSLQNHVSIKKETTDGNSATGKVDNVSVADPVEKESGGVAKDDEQTVEITWNVTFNGPISFEVDKEYWEYVDTLDDTNQVITSDQLKEVEDSLKSLFGAQYVTVTAGNTRSVGKVSGYDGFTVKVTKEISKGDYEVSYHTTGYIVDGFSRAQYKNSGYVYYKRFTKTATASYEPMITKYDGNGHSEDSSYEYYTDTLFNEGILTWVIKVVIPENSNYESLKITDTLPADVNMQEVYNASTGDVYGLEVAYDDSFNNAAHFTGNSATLGNTVFTKEDSGSDIYITFDPSEYNTSGKTLYFRVRAKIDDSYAWTDGSGYFKNQTWLHSENGTQLGYDSQGQTITKTSNLLVKDGTSEVSGAINQIKYTLEVNPDGKTLLPDVAEKELTLHDTLTTSYTVNKGDELVTVTLLLQSIKFYDGETGEELTDGFSYITSSDLEVVNKYKSWQQVALDSEDYDQITYEAHNGIEITIPDGKHIKVEYIYAFEGTSNQQISTSNNATIDGVAVDYDKSHKDLTYSIQDSKAHLYAHQVQLYKVDSENYEILLNGATFKLYKYDATNGWTDTGLTFTTASDVFGDGHASISAGDSGLDYNTAYYLVESDLSDELKTKYSVSSEKLYFCVLGTSGSDGDESEMIVPDNFEELGGKYIADGSSLYYENEKNTTSINLKKEWDYSSLNSDDSVQPQSIEVELGRKYGSLIDEDTKHYCNVIIAKRAKVDGNRSVQLVSLPSIEAGTTIKISYYYTDQWNPPVLYIDGVQQDYNGDDTTSGHWVSFDYVVNKDTRIVVVYTAQNSSQCAQLPNITYSYDSGTVSTNSGDLTGQEDKDFDYETITITESESWQKEINNLEKYVTVGDKKYRWLYYVKEVRSYYYDDVYSDNNGGISSGTIVITNKRNYNEAYSLPKTGGIGDEPIKAAGYGFMGIAFVGMTYTFIKRKKKTRLKSGQGF